MSKLSHYYVEDYRDTHDYLKLIEMKGLVDLPPLIISCAITGGIHGAEANPNLPEEPKDQVQAAYDAYNAGASIVHIHRRNPENISQMSYKAEEFLEINQMVRAKCPELIINNTCMGGRWVDVDNQTVSDLLLASLPARPEIASIDLTCFSTHMRLKARKDKLPGREEDTNLKFNYFIDLGDAETAIKEFKKYDVKPELELFEIGNLKYIHHLIRKGLLESPHWIQMIFGGNGTYPTPEMLIQSAQYMPGDSLFSVIGIGGAQTALLTIAMILGHHVRVGLEDNVYYSYGELAKSNAQLVERMVRIAKEVGRPIATPAQAREMLGLDPTPRKY